MKKLFKLNSLLLFAIFMCASVQSQTYWVDDFSDSNFKSNYDMSFGQNWKFIPNGGPGGNGCVEVTVVKNTHNGGSMKYLLKENLGFEPEELYAEYSVRYDKDMKEYGGKAPGFSGTYERSGWGNRPGYGKAGWSARGTINADNQPYVKNKWYVYHTYTNYDAPNCPGSTDYRKCNPFPYDVSNPGSQPQASEKTWGSGINWGNKGDMQFDRWYDVKQYIKLNTVGKNNGILRVWVNGQLAHQITNMNFRRDNKLKIYAYWFNYYNGGSNTIRETGHVMIDNFKLYGPNGTGKISVKEVSVSPKSNAIDVGESNTLIAKISPSNATDQSVTWSSSDSSIATVNSSGVITGESEGTAIITAKTNDGNHTDTSSVTVTCPPGGGKVINVALNKQTTASNYDADNISANLVDNNTGTRWSAENFPQWLEIDLGSVKNINTTEVIAYQDRAYQFKIESKTSANGTYNQIVNRSNNTQGGSISNPIKDTFSPVDARFLRITVTGASGYTGSWVSLSELKALGKNDCTTLSTDDISISDNKVTVYPNPFNSELKINMENSNSFEKVVLYDMSGRIINQTNTNNQNSVIIPNLSEIASGVYLLKLSGQSNTKSMVVIKE